MPCNHSNKADGDSNQPGLPFGASITPTSQTQAIPPSLLRASSVPVTYPRNTRKGVCVNIVVSYTPIQAQDDLHLTNNYVTVARG